MWILIGGGKPQWNTMMHNGPYFAELYVKHNIPVIINNEKIILENLAEEYATLYAKYIKTDYINKNIFNKNFTKDFFKVLPKELIKKYNLKSVTEINFSLINKKLEKDREFKLNRSNEVKEKQKKDRLENEEPYMYCMIDGSKVKVGNYKIEPPGIFLGRGTHPKLGMIKKRVDPKDVTINLGKDSTVPKPNVNGQWGKITHEKDKIWLASWKDRITGKTKYVFTSVESIFKSKSDMDKFDLARKLKRKVNSIRDEYIKELESDDLKLKQMATALYFIDKLALRVGGKKDTKGQADTVGVTSLRVEHISFIDDVKKIIKLDFLGKDSIRYCHKVDVPNNIYKNLLLFTNNKDKKNDLFDKIDSKTLNSHLEKFMKGLTAKVWRTYNASFLFQKELDKIKPDKICGISENERLNYLLGLFNMANTKVALLCNHQKNVPSNINATIERIDNMLKKLKKKKKKTKERKSKIEKEEFNIKINKIDSKIKLLRLKKETKSKMKNVSLGTSKMNYIDPRIVFAFMKRFQIPEEKLFTKTLLSRFKWASEVDREFRF
tara:strand:+ start:213 stop:1862 length:1650 start_codon:yes stop_codon:yes gene_type:complete